MKLEQLEKDHYYHVYNRGINGCAIFKNEENKKYFLKLFNKYLSGRLDVLAYCLMQNHYHFVVKITSEENEITQSFSNFLNAYAKAFNKSMGRSGSLFEKHFKRKKITDEAYLRNLIIYIHKNPQNHEFYNFSSYRIYLGNLEESPFPLSLKEGVELFDNIENFKFMHEEKILDNQKDLGLDLQGTPQKDGEYLAGQEQLLQGVPQVRGLLVGMTDIKTQFVNYIHNLQDQITAALEEVDGKAKFHEDPWEREEGGGGRTRVIEDGAVIEKGGVNISMVHGALAPAMQDYFDVGDVDFFACGLSLVIHPKNPYAPTVHANWRYFEMYEKDGTLIDSWFGGGQDLTPYYLFEEDAEHFHEVCKTACDAHDPDFYVKFKAKCDAYFYNAHRGEGRGLGGLFFDHCKAKEGRSMQDWYNFVTEIGDSFLDAYLPILKKRKDIAYGEKEITWQQIRRGRYVEFNLVHDKGTLFGLKTNGRIESILMSLPPIVQWKYDHKPEPGSEEEKLLEVLKNPKNWA
jgi:coproporphyrinogen III oxidase/REP element-mobilizing transposase RayT